MTTKTHVFQQVGFKGEISTARLILGLESSIHNAWQSTGPTCFVVLGPDFFPSWCVPVAGFPPVGPRVVDGSDVL